MSLLPKLPIPKVRPKYLVGMIVRSGEMLRVVARTNDDMLMFRSFAPLGTMAASHCYADTFTRNMDIGAYVPVNFHVTDTGWPLFTRLKHEDAEALAKRVKPAYRDLIVPMGSHWLGESGERIVNSMRQGHIQHRDSKDTKELPLLRSQPLLNFLLDHTRLHLTVS